MATKTVSNSWKYIAIAFIVLFVLTLFSFMAMSSYSSSSSQQTSQCNSQLQALQGQYQSLESNYNSLNSNYQSLQTQCQSLQSTCSSLTIKFAKTKCCSGILGIGNKPYYYVVGSDIICTDERALSQGNTGC